MRSITGRWGAYMMYLLVEGLVRSGSVYEALVYWEREGRIIVIHEVIPHALGSTLQMLWCKAEKDLQEGKRARLTWSRTVMTM